MSDTHQYRVYADGNLVHEDEWAGMDISFPYYDDYAIRDFPSDLEEDDIFEILEKEEEQRYAELRKLRQQEAHYG